ncbi:MAG: ribonuclease HII [Alphaproteobacteria bacterium]
MPDLRLEREIGGVVAGIDEAGRGPLAGPVVAAAVILRLERLPKKLIRDIDDSKKLTAARREALFDVIGEFAVIGVGEASVEEIDRLNILRATFLAMRRAVGNLTHAPDVALVDGNQVPPLPCRVRTVIGGDARSLSIAAASIMAKVTRDRFMSRMAERYPGYGWETNVGYGTPQHLEALKMLGPTPLHRTTFAPLARLPGID